uniref:Calmodulin-binding domain-containing protein n=1 Tax=Plectus sambesii TaxID=2011161 RepID=A0A914WIB6_9BILA
MANPASNATAIRIATDERRPLLQNYNNNNDQNHQRKTSLQAAQYPVLLVTAAERRTPNTTVIWSAGQVSPDSPPSVYYYPKSEIGSKPAAAVEIREGENELRSGSTPAPTPTTSDAAADSPLLCVTTSSGRLSSANAAGSSGAGSARGRFERRRLGAPAAYHHSFDAASIAEASGRTRRRSGSSGGDGGDADVNDSYRHNHCRHQRASPVTVTLSTSCGHLGEHATSAVRTRRPGGHHHASGGSYRDCSRTRCCFYPPGTSVVGGGTVYGGRNSGSSFRGGTCGTIRSSPRRQHSADSASGEIGQISVNWMRLNGAIQPFKTLLSSTVSSAATPATANNASQRRKVFQSQTDSLRHSDCFDTKLSVDTHASSVLNADVVSLRKSQVSLLVVGGDEVAAVVPSPQTATAPGGGGRLFQRHQLYEARRVTSDFALFAALLGIALMIIENELSAAKFYEKSSWQSYLLKAFILLSTLTLLVLVAKFHLHEIQLFMSDNSAEDWRIAVTWNRVMKISLELIICSICPLPVNVHFSWTTVHADGETVTTTDVPIDVMLSIPMFLRMYWICRVMLLHSKLFTDASSRSIGALNRVNFNARFVLKTLMTLCPGTVLMVFTASLWVIAAWILRLCERYHTGDPINIQAQKHQNYLNSLWMIAITFLSVGYGDIVPNTYCGRGMAVITGILGTGTSSMVVAVIARKLELTRAEKHVHNFMMDTQLTKKLKHSAANVLRETWLIYKYRRLDTKIDPSRIRLHQRKFLMAIYQLRKVKRDQRKLAENSATLGDVAKTASNTYELIHDIHSWQEGLSLRMTALENQMSDIQRELGSLSEFLRRRDSSVIEEEHTSLTTPVENLRRRRPIMDFT